MISVQVLLEFEKLSTVDCTYVIDFNISPGTAIYGGSNTSACSLSADKLSVSCCNE